MSTLTLDGTAAAAKPTVQRCKADTLRVAALALISIRFIQGFVYWGGGSRRFIYAPAKLDPSAALWLQATSAYADMQFRQRTQSPAGW
jgi:hypothetical protein